ncbi:MAG: fumarate hydratase [Bdellovibrionales bacterium GWB1_55_8]|nr:MAG: fumarate hydratase [Bdellovibrionales bacterium GWB1_55_8]
MNATQQKKFLEAFIEIIRKTSTELPKDVIEAVQKGMQAEQAGSNAKYAFEIIEKNIGLAKQKSQPLCQDTGSILFYVHYPRKFDGEALAKVMRKAVVDATKKGYLRQNSVDSLTGKNSGTNIGPGSPSLHLEPWNKDHFDVRLMLKGGGCENMGVQYSLPDNRIGAGRDVAGVKKCILDAVQNAQGKGCGPGILGVAIGGDRGAGYLESKEQLLRKMGDKNPDPVLAGIEEETVREANTLGIGPMGFGGKTTLMGVKVGALNRLPASFFVSVSYMCWAFRRQGAQVSAKGEIKKWLY